MNKEHLCPNDCTWLACMDTDNPCCNKYGEGLAYKPKTADVLRLAACINEEYMDTPINGWTEPKRECFSNFDKDRSACIECDQRDTCAEKYFADIHGFEVRKPKTAPKNHKLEGKPRASLIPWDILIEYLTPTYEEGVFKYKKESWRDGFHISVLYDALQRHLTAFFYKHEDTDPEITKPGLRAYHLGAAMFCILSMIWTLKTRPELDDRPTHNIPVLENEEKEEV